jgi:HEAT repeat protein
MLTACSLAVALALPVLAEPATQADLPKLVAEMAKYESGQNAEPVLKIEQLLRDSFANPGLRKELEAGLAKLLVPTATFEARRFACQWLAAIGTEASLPAIAKLLADEQTAGIACLALSSQRSPKANAVLRSALAAARGPARVQLISAVGSHQDAEAVPALTQLAADADAAVAETAIRALGKIGTAAAHDALAALVKTAKPAQRCAATEATMRVAEQLGAAGDRKAAVAIYAEQLKPKTPTNVRCGALAALIGLDADGGQQRILATLRAGDPALVPVAIARIARLKSADASKTFAAELPKLSPAAQAWMIEALADRGDAVARQAICAQLSTSDAGVRRAAIAAVGKLEDTTAVAPLVKILATVSTPEDFLDVEVALVNLRGGAATDAALVAALSQSSGEAKLRLFSVLTRRGARAAIPALLAEAGGTDTPVVQAAFLALGKLAVAGDLPVVLEKVVSLKAADARTDAELAAARAMAKVADVAQRSQTLRAALAKTADVETRCSFLRLLPSAPDAQALGALGAAQSDKETKIRDAAVRALATWPDTTGWDALLAVFQKPESNTHRALALRAMVRLATALNATPDAALIQRYRQLLTGARNDDERRLVVGSLAGVAHPGALDLALPLLSHPGVRAETALAVRKIAAAVKAEHPQAAQAALERLKPAKKPAR